MFFLHAPKLVLTGSSSTLRATGDRAAALGAEVVVVVEPRAAGDGGTAAADAVTAACVAELDGFDVALVTVCDAASADVDLRDAAARLAPALRHGALVLVQSVACIELEGRRLAADLAERSGLEVGRHFDVVGLEGDDVTWSTGEEGAETARHLMSRLG
ncbi:hypothetical protein ES689_15210 [Frigoribacterium sp. ACAM 257]|uniref:hypothetical protein n=1 Tax=Frigoribacterium sp. ACAM 257 TaxID=2508998 RepID=UPI0011BA0A8A|nr:hypothetical protein [Frigoribacterium sp. ACAM 257]TWX34014.1 hypothetical protein ES689_15210 [Frigoribacterium sp. ACAM 257]